MLSQLPNPEFKDVGEFCDYFRKNKVERQLGNFEQIWRKQRAVLNAAKVDFMEKADASDEAWAKDPKQVAARLAELEEKVKSDWSLSLQLPQVKSIWQLQSIIDWHDGSPVAEGGKKSKEIVQADPDHKTSGSRRRMKLFYAAKHVDPQTEIVQTAGWVVAVCRSKEATAPFGRLKPKVLKGTNEVDPKCNLEDWEGIDSKSKAWRDDPDASPSDFVRDGVTDEHGHSFDMLTGEASQVSAQDGHRFCETAWCFTGVLAKKWGWSQIKGSSDFNNYTESGKRPVLVMMDTARGALYAYAHFMRSGSEIENFLNENEKCDGDPKNGGDPSDARQKKFLDDFKSSHPEFASLLDKLNRKYYPDLAPADVEDEMSYDDYKAGEVQKSVAVSGAHPAAVRRLKLFKAAEHWGATVIKTPKWVVAVCSANQMQPFGRYKPIASKDDPSKPDPKYNLEDWEGIGAAEKSIRDRVDYEACKKYDCVQDGVTDGYGISYNHLEGHSGQGSHVKYAESCWCVSGALDNDNFPWGKHSFTYTGFSSYTSGSGGKAFVCMDMARGAMYLWTVGGSGEDNIANERDSMDSFPMSSANSGSKQATWFKNNFLPSHPELAQLIAALKKKYGGKSLSISNVLTPDQLYKEAQGAGLVMPNGALRIESADRAKRYRPILNRFARLVVTTPACSHMF